MGFPFETIYNDQEKEALAGRLLAFFGFNVELGNDLNMSPNQFVLYPNFPNPFNPTTTIRFSVDTHQVTSLLIYDIQGRLIETLVDRAIEPGNHEMQWNASHITSSVYFLELRHGVKRDVRKIVFVK